MGEAPELSIVLATSHAWPVAKPMLNGIFGADDAPHLEVILCDGHGAGAPPESERDPRLRVISVPGESVFGLRAKGIAAARGDVLAITEDHCIPAADWPRAILAAHERHPDAAAIAGAVTNGSTDSAWDWANFLMTFADHMPPVPTPETVRAPSVANGSVKRAAAGIPPDPEPGWFESKLMGELVQTGRAVRDDGPRVSHVQSHGGALSTLGQHFHNGRATAGLRIERPGVAAVRAEAGRLVQLSRQLTRELRTALASRPPIDRGAVAGARRVPLIATAHALGELTGLLAGPGSSPARLD